MLGWNRRHPVQKALAQGTPPVWALAQAIAEKWSTGKGQAFEKTGTRYLDSDLAFVPIQIVASLGAKAPLGLFDPKGKKNEDGTPSKEAQINDDAHAFYQLWQSPNPWESTYEFLKALIITFMTSDTGAFIHLMDDREPVEYNGPSGKGMLYEEIKGPPTTIFNLEPGGMKVVPSKREYIKHYRYKKGGEIVYFHPSTILHLKEFNPLSQFESVSVLRPSALATSSDVAAQLSNRAMFFNGLRASGFLTSDEMMVDEDQLTLMEKMLAESYTGDPQKSHQVVPLWGGFKFDPATISPRDAEFTEGTKQNRYRAYGVARVHPGVILSEDVNLANANVAIKVTRTFGVDPVLTLISSKISKDILPLYESPALAHFTGVVPEDKKQTAEIEKLQAEKEVAAAQATQALMATLGDEQGLAEAKRKGLVSEEVSVPPPSPTETPAPFPFSFEVETDEEGSEAPNGSNGLPATFFRRTRYP